LLNITAAQFIYCQRASGVIALVFFYLFDRTLRFNIARIRRNAAARSFARSQPGMWRSMSTMARRSAALSAAYACAKF
jgi:hypothetical protein